MLGVFGGSFKVDLIDEIKARLLHDADQAFRNNERKRCVEAIEELYKTFDDENERYP